MKYIKKYEQMQVSGMGDQELLGNIMLEIEYTKEIEKIFKKYNLKKLDVPINDVNSLNNNILTIYYGDFYDGSETIYQIIGGEKQELAVGTPRNIVYKIYEEILDFLYKLYPSDLEDYMSKKSSKKYNL